jgi:hypothetical protein
MPNLYGHGYSDGSYIVIAMAEQGLGVIRETLDALDRAAVYVGYCRGLT